MGLIGAIEAFNLHRPRPPQTPAPSFKSPYRRCPGDQRWAPHKSSAPRRLWKNGVRIFTISAQVP